MKRSELNTLINALSTGDKNTALEVRNILLQISKSIFLPGELKFLICTEEYINENFTNTGLGRNEYEGWARCNGLNETLDWTGRTLIGYGDSYPEVGFFGGKSKHTLIESELPIISPINGSYFKKGNTSPGITGLTIANGISGDFAPGELIKPFGGGVAHNIMQPYIVVVVIQYKG